MMMMLMMGEGICCFFGLYIYILFFRDRVSSCLEMRPGLWIIYACLHREKSRHAHRCMSIHRWCTRVGR